MQFKYLNKKNNENIIFFFNGWGMNESPVVHLKADNYDIIMFYDYRNLDIDFNIFNLEKYKNKYLVSWSMGVFTANFFKNILDNFDKKIAINGTGIIVSDKFGIPEKIYKLTLDYLSEASIEKFKKNMFLNGKLNPNVTITRSIEELKEELISIKNLKTKDLIKYDKVIISSEDKIIPTKNQINYWQDKLNYEIINSTHCPFENYLSWQDIVC